MLRYNEAETIAALTRVSMQSRVAFAAACAERLFPAYEDYYKRAGRGDPTALAGILSRVWAALLDAEMGADQMHAEIGGCMALVPQEDVEPWVDEQAYADDAVSAVAYTLRALESGRTQEAAWAARRAYEAVDHHVMNRLGIEGDERVLSHPVVQSELERQSRDLDELHQARLPPGELVAHLRDRAKAEAPTLFVPRP